MRSKCNEKVSNRSHNRNNKYPSTTETRTWRTRLIFPPVVARKAPSLAASFSPNARKICKTVSRILLQTDIFHANKNSTRDLLFYSQVCFAYRHRYKLFGSVSVYLFFFATWWYAGELINDGVDSVVAPRRRWWRISRRDLIILLFLFV